MDQPIKEDLIYLNALNRVSFLGPVRISALIDHFGSASEAWSSPAGRVEQVPGLKDLGERFCRERRSIDPDREWSRLLELKIHSISTACPGYPPLLRQISRPPPLLYYRGSLQDPDNIAVAVVGSRRCTFYGREVAVRLGGELAAAGLTVVSGMALGIDSAAHRGALEAGGRTIAVLGCGPERCYPPGNASLMADIVSSGAVLSEFALDTPPLPQHFPQRNRIISGLSLGTVVVEATAKSGALITAHFSLEQNREVFAVPGNVGSPYSRGCHRLIREGARLVETAADILEELNIGPVSVEAPATGENRTQPALSGEESAVLELIPYKPIHIDEIVRLSGTGADRIGSILLSLELKGLVCQMTGKYFSRF